MFGEVILLARVGKFILNAVQAYAQTDEGSAELQSIEDELTAAEADGSNGMETAMRTVTNTLDEARANVRKAKGG